ncbi:glycosyltransferase [Pseudonocardia sp.]|uniref:glycosyltransferase n=1 Tax=Pseudonocardia sp. TaxID=60912 RepID=UPI003D133D31
MRRDTPTPRTPTAKLVVVGQDPDGVRLALNGVRAGYHVVGLDPDPRRVGDLARGRAYVEGVDRDVLGDALRSGRYVPSRDPRTAQGFATAVIMIPPGRSAEEVSALLGSATAVLAPHVRPRVTVVLDAPAGSRVDLRLVTAPLEAGSGLRAGHDFAVGLSSQPRLTTPARPGRYVEALDERSPASVSAFYRSLTAPGPIRTPPAVSPAPARPPATPPAAPRRPAAPPEVLVPAPRVSPEGAPPPAARPAPARRSRATRSAPAPSRVATVSVIVPAHNEEAGIASTIEGLLEQETPEWLHVSAIVVVVNNSTDRTAEIARRYPVTVLEMLDNKHKKSGAMNYAWGLCGQGSEFVLTMDADTVLLPDTVEKMARELVGNPVLGAVCARYWAKPGRGLVRRLQRLEYARYDDLRDLRGWKVNVASGAAAMYRRVALEKVVELRGKPEPWDNESLIEDYALTLDLKTKGFRVAAARGAHVYTEPPTTFRMLWRQRLRWGRGGMDECLKRGWTLATRRDILSYLLFAWSVFFRFLWVTMLVLMVTFNVPLRFALIGLIPVVVMWAERMTSAWRLPDRSWGDVALVAVLLVEDLYGFFLELCAVAAAGKCLRGIRQYW